MRPSLFRPAALPRRAMPSDAKRSRRSRLSFCAKKLRDQADQGRAGLGTSVFPRRKIVGWKCVGLGWVCLVVFSFWGKPLWMGAVSPHATSGCPPNAPQEVSSLRSELRAKGNEVPHGEEGPFLVSSGRRRDASNGSW